VLQRSRRIMVLMAIATGAAGLSACVLQVFDPCPENDHIEDVGQLDQTWILSTVNNAPLPYSYPFKSEIINAVTIDFQTDNFERGGECADTRKTFGRAIMRAVITKNGSPSLKYAAGRFFRDHGTNSSRLFALGYQLQLDRNSPTGTIITATSSTAIADDGSAAFLIDPGLTLRFVRTVGPTDLTLFIKLLPQVCTVSVGVPSTGALSC